MQALRFAQSIQFTLPQTGAVSFDSTHVYFFGHSQGANTGIPALAVTDRAYAAVLSGAGGSDVMRGVLTRTSPNREADTLADLVKDEVDETHPAVTVMQNAFDVFDVANYAPMLVEHPPVGVASKHVLLPWGASDTWSPNATLDITASAMGLQLAPPVIEPIPGMTEVPRPVAGNVDGFTAVCTQYEPAPGSDGLFVYAENAAAVTDWLAFLVSAQGGTPVVP
jgi:hypothetical protein